MNKEIAKEVEVVDVTKNGKPAAAPAKRKFVVKTLDDPELLSRVKVWIPSQCMALDYVLGGKGWPVRRIVEVYGDNSTGKSLMATAACAETQRVGGMAAYADTELAQDPERMVALGVDPKTLAMDYPDTLDELFEFLDEMIKYKNAKLGKEAPLTFIWDSVAAMVTKAELERSAKEGVESKNYPDVPRALSVAFRQNVHKVAEENILLFITNQTREKLGMFVADGPATTGGNALKFYASVRVELQTRGKLKEGKRIIGANVQATTVKNRLAAPFQTLLLPVYYAYGINEAEAALDYLMEQELVEHEKASSWYAIKFGEEEVKFQRKQWTDIFIERYDEVGQFFKGLKA